MIVLFMMAFSNFRVAMTQQNAVELPILGDLDQIEFYYLESALPFNAPESIR
jgi:hypothetical protein